MAARRGTSRLGPVAQEVRRDALLALQAAGVVLQAQVISEYSTPGRGRVYQKYNPRRVHQASLPNDPPAPDTGALRNSVTLENTPTGVRVSTNLVYAPLLEYGTPRIAPRPAWRPAIEKTKDQIGPEIATTLSRGRV